jgi:hypothetical protein
VNAESRKKGGHFILFSLENKSFDHILFY